MKYLPLLATAAIISLSGCSKTNDYVPPEGASGEEIFKAACVSCHESKGDHTFELSAEMDDSALAMKINKGSFSMPGFHNIQGQPLVDLIAYVRSQNKAQ